MANSNPISHKYNLIWCGMLWFQKYSGATWRKNNDDKWEDEKSYRDVNINNETHTHALTTFAPELTTKRFAHMYYNEDL